MSSERCCGVTHWHDLPPEEPEWRDDTPKPCPTCGAEDVWVGRDIHFDDDINLFRLVWVPQATDEESARWGPTKEWDGWLLCEAIDRANSLAADAFLANRALDRLARISPKLRALVAKPLTHGSSVERGERDISLIAERREGARAVGVIVADCTDVLYLLESTDA